METLKTRVAILAICSSLYQSSVGCGKTIEYAGYSRVIQSPNYGAEYGKVANCSWQFKSINSRYALRLNVSNMKMFYRDVNGTKQCGDSYRLVINGEKVDCMLNILSESNAKYYNFYSDASCTKFECGLHCDNKIKIDSSTIRVEYIANGSKPSNAKPDKMHGFNINYQYMKCLKNNGAVGTTSGITRASPTSLQKEKNANPTTTNPTTTTSAAPATTRKATTVLASTTTTPTTTTTTTTPETTRTTTSAPPATTQTTLISASIPTTSPQPQSKSYGHLRPSTVSSTSSRVESDSGMPINNQGESKPNKSLLYGLIGGGVALLILIAIIIFIVRKRNRENKTGKSGSGDDESGHCMTENALYVTSEDLADDVDHTSVDPAVVYTAVDKSAKTQKTGGPQYAEDSQSDDAGHASMDTPVLYAVVDKSSKSSETEVPTYAQVDISAKLIDQDNNQSEPRPPTNRQFTQP